MSGQHTRAEHKPSFGNLVISHLINGNDAEMTGAFGKRAGDDLMIDDPIPQHHAIDQTPKQIWLLKTGKVSLTNLGRAVGEAL